MKRVFLFAVLVASFVQSLLAQPAASFLYDSEYCPNEVISLNNTSTGAVDYEWDFCLGALGSASTGSLLVDTDIPTATGLAVIHQEDKVVVYVTDRTSGNLYRFIYSRGFQSLLSTTLLGNITAGLNDISIVKRNGNWYGYVGSGSGKLFQINLGSDLQSAISFSEISLPTSLTTVEDVAIIRSDNKDYIITIGGGANNGELSVLSYTSGLPNGSFTQKKYQVPSGNILIGLSMVKEGNRWVGIASGPSGLHILDFKNGLDSAPTYTLRTNLVNQPRDIHLEWELGILYGFVTSNNTGKLYRLNFGNSILNTATSVDLGNYSSLLADNRGLSFIKEGRFSNLISVSPATGRMANVAIANSCGINMSLVASPQIQYTALGDYTVRLTATDASGNSSKVENKIKVKNIDLVLSVSGSTCTQLPTSFSLSSLKPLQQIAWNFGDGASSNALNPTYQYSTAGTYTVSYTATNAFGCSTSSSSSVIIYQEPPIPSFSISGILCGPGEITFTNLTNDTGYNGPLTYEWDFNGQATSNQRDATFSFGSAGTKTITLTSKIPGCENTVQQQINLVSGPTSLFSASSVCQGDLMTFQNQSSGAVSYLWNFGDGITSSQASVTHLYTGSGNYQVELQATGPSGCTAIFNQEVSVSAKPIANFDYDIPCSGSEGITFYDLSTVPSADILAWDWYVDGALVTSEQSPLISIDNAGAHTVRLEVLGSNGCSSFVEKSLTVLGSPVPAFQVTRGCQGQASVFTDVSTGAGAVSRLWTINGQNYTTPTVSQLFNTAGTFDVSLTVTAANFCSATTSSTFTVIPSPAIDFSMSSVCTGDDIILSDITTSPDPIVSRTWSLDGAPFSNGPQALLSGISSGSHSIDLKITTANGCVFSKARAIQLLTSPEAAFDASATYGVPPFPVTLTNQSTNATSYVWRLNGVQISTSASFTQMISQEGNHEIELTATSADGCEDTFSRSLLSAQPAINLQVRQVTLNENANTQSISLKVGNIGNFPVEIFDVTISAGDDFSVTQRFNQFLAINAETQVNLTSGFTLLNANRICVSVTSAYDDVSLDDNMECVGFSSNAIFETPYPNPFSDEAVIRLILPSSTDVRLTISHVSGRTMVDEQYNALATGLHVLRYDASQWEKGIYLVTIRFGSKVVVRKILKF